MGRSARGHAATVALSPPFFPVGHRAKCRDLREVARCPLLPHRGEGARRADERRGSAAKSLEQAAARPPLTLRCFQQAPGLLNSLREPRLIPLPGRGEGCTDLNLPIVIPNGCPAQAGRRSGTHNPGLSPDSAGFRERSARMGPGAPACLRRLSGRDDNTTARRISETYPHRFNSAYARRRFPGWEA